MRHRVSNRPAKTRSVKARSAKNARQASKSRLTHARREREQQPLSKAVKTLAGSAAVTSMLGYAAQMHADSRKFTEESFEVELGLCRALVAASAWFAMALSANRGDARLYPRDWIEPQATCNPDVVMGCVLCQVSNYGYSVVHLVDRGLDTPARAVLRSAADLCYMLALLAHDRQTLQSYVLDKSVTEKERWYNLFSNRKLTSRFKEIDRVIGLPSEWTKFMEEFRVLNNGFFSEATHHSPSAILVGSLPHNPETGRVELGLLGGPNRFSQATVSHLLTVMNYGLTMFLDSLKAFNPQFELPHFWSPGVELVNGVQPLFVDWLHTREESSDAEALSIRRGGQPRSDLERR